MADTTRSCLIIADISGYTEYLAGVELEHAHDILADLMTTVVKALRPGFKLSKLEGDAAFVYAPTDQVDGSILMDSIEGCYFAFRQRLLSIQQASTCECNACALIPNLNLKLVAHHGSVVIHKVAGRSELVGSDVIVVHRLLKNTISEPAYAFISDVCMNLTDLDPPALGMRRHTETYEHVGEVGGWVLDLEQAWRAYRERKEVYVNEKQAALSYSAFLPAPPQLVWEYISSPQLRAQWGMGLDRVDQLDQTGRRRPGTLNHCMHGEDMILQEFIDWRPPRYYTSKATLPGGFVVISTHEVEPVDGGAILHDRFRKPSAKQHPEAMQQLKEMFDQGHPLEHDRLARLLREALESAGADPEPELPTVDEVRRLASAID
ncbi:MAG: DUF2652 domain-containing protein [Acidimicrobiia bacterium]